MKNKGYKLNRSSTNALYDEEINYNLSNRNIHDTTSSSQYKKEYEFDIDNDLNNLIITKNSTQKEYWLEEKNRYIQELEKKLQKQENTINNLVKYKKKFEEKIKNKENYNNNNNNRSYNSNRIPTTNYFNFDSLENDLNYDFANRKMAKRLNKEDNIKNKTYINFITDAKIINDRKNNSKDKYNALYSKYLQLNNDFKYLNNNNNNDMNHMKNKYNKLQTDYNKLKKTINEKNKIIEMQKSEINKIKNNNENSNSKIQSV